MRFLRALPAAHWINCFSSSYCIIYFLFFFPPLFSGIRYFMILPFNYSIQGFTTHCKLTLFFFFFLIQLINVLVKLYSFRHDEHHYLSSFFLPHLFPCLLFPRVFLSRLIYTITSLSQETLLFGCRTQVSNWPPIKPLLRNTLAGSRNEQNAATFFVKVYKEGVPIGRKLDLYALKDYDGLIRTLCLMFRTSIVMSKQKKKSHPVIQITLGFLIIQN